MINNPPPDQSKTTTPFDPYVPPKSTKTEIAAQIAIALLAVGVIICVVVLG